MTRPTLLLTALLLGALPASLPAVTLDGLYTVTVPQAGTGAAAQQEALREAMRDVLVRATGRADAPQLETLAPLVANASRYVLSFRRVAGGKLAVTFDGHSIENAIDASGLAYWGAQRPLTLVWLAVDRGGRPALVTAGSPGPERERVEQAAERRGLPLAWPAAGEDAGRALQRIAAGDHAGLAAAARRYGADAVLIGQADAGQAVDWHFIGAGTGQLRGGLEDGPQLAADRMAAALATRSTGQRSDELVTVTGVDSLEQYAAALAALERLPVVRAVRVEEVTPQAMSCVVTVRGDFRALHEAILRDGRLSVVDASRQVYALGP